MLAVPDASVVAQPVPAKLEKLGLESFMAVWPSHLAYAQFVGDSVAERVTDALGPPSDFSDGPQPADVGAVAPSCGPGGTVTTSPGGPGPTSPPSTASPAS